MERITGSSVTVKATFYKLALDQGVFAPLFQFPVLTYIGFLQGQNFADIKTKIRSQWWDIVTTGWKVSAVCLICLYRWITAYYDYFFFFKP